MFNLSFLNSSALILSFAALIPLLIYLFAKKRPPRIIFSSIRFIQMSQKKQKKKMNIKNLLLLIIRMLIILLIVLAISRPALKIESLKGTSRHPSTAVAVILDNSYSMDFVVDTQTELDKGQKIADEIGNMLTTDDVSIVYSLDKSWNEQNAVLNYGAYDRSLLYTIKLTPQPVELSEVLEDAENKLLQSDLPNREIYLITDLQYQELPDDMNTPLFIIPSSEVEERTNLSIQQAVLGSNFVERGIERQIDFVAVNHSDKLVEDAICSLVLDGRTTAEKVIDLQQRERQQNSFMISLEEPGWHSGYVNIKDERLIYDNRYYFSFYYDHQPDIGIITKEREIPATLQTMLSIYAGNEDNIEILNDNLSLERLENFDNIIVWSYPDWDGQLQFLLSNLLQQKRNILFLGDNDLSDAARNFLSNEFDLQFEHLLTEDKILKITHINSYHPVAVRLKESRPAGLHSLWLSSTSANVILEAENYPVAVEKAGNILWLFDIKDLRSSFLIDANYPVLAYNSLMYTASSGLGSRQFVSGRSYHSNAEYIKLPDGSQLTTGGRKLTLKQPGLYYSGKEAVPLAVNLDYTESDFTALEAGDNPQIEICDSNWQETIFQARYGFELWKYLIVLILILFALEIIIIKSEEKKG